jgi:tetratricopeptide (TPR) repeat protein
VKRTALLVAVICLFVAVEAQAGGRSTRDRLVRARADLTKANYAADLDGMLRIGAEMGALAERESGSLRWLEAYDAGFAMYMASGMVGPGSLAVPEGDLKRSRAYVEEAVRRLELAHQDGGHAEVEALLAMCYGTMIYFDPAKLAPEMTPKIRAAVARASELEPGNPRVLLFGAINNLWSTWFAGGDRQKAVARWREALGRFGKEPEKEPLLPDWGQADGWAWLAQLYMVMEPPDVREAKAAVDQALRLRPDFAWARKGLLPKIEARLEREASTKTTW